MTVLDSVVNGELTIPAVTADFSDEEPGEAEEVTEK